MAMKAPFRVIPRVIKNEHRYLAEAAHKALRKDRAACPKCGNGMLRPTEAKELRRCDGCGSVVSLDDLAIHHGYRLDATAAQRQDYFLRSATTMFLIACAVLSGAVLYSGWTGSPLLMFAAFLLSIPLFMGCFAMRYRAWQAATGRAYEVEAPFGDFIRDLVWSWLGERTVNRSTTSKEDMFDRKAAYLRAKAQVEHRARFQGASDRDRAHDRDGRG